MCDSQGRTITLTITKTELKHSRNIFDSKKMKLKYDGKEDEIIKLLEAGNVEMEGETKVLAIMLSS